MSTIEKMREVADLLMNQRKYDEAYTIFDELYRQIWNIIGSVQCNSSGYSTHYLGSRTYSGEMLRKLYPEPAANVLCERMYSMSLTLMLNEFIQIMRGHLQCITSSWQIRKETTSDNVLNEFAVLYAVALQPVQQRKLVPIFSIATAVMDRSNRVKRIIANHPRTIIEKLLIENAQKCNNGKLKSINSLLLDYLLTIGDRKTELFKRLSIIVGPTSYRFKYDQHYSSQYDTYNRYKRYGGYKQYTSSSSNKFYSATATEEEKNAVLWKINRLDGTSNKGTNPIKIHRAYFSLSSRSGATFSSRV